VILEYCEFGALDHYLKNNDIDDDIKILLAGDCAEGLMYLTERGFIHRDV
jgi:serine/threonine protein kinase